ncbi:hypothetical protein GE061_020270 [Apolygus lucorum]|uniref:C2H2-type domain-containing protein n=1 Tax=Apolygus lucorum TaxID=248454 RepID=A0A8S9WNG4_APOLU|nr:hypothetical protein GE061_020270 [Apolygus lucorum]
MQESTFRQLSEIQEESTCVQIAVEVTSSGVICSPIEDPRRIHECPRCGRRYLQRSHMLAHKRLECGKEPTFACPHCSHRAFQKSNLKKHLIRKHYFEYMNQKGPY